MSQAPNAHEVSIVDMWMQKVAAVRAAGGSSCVVDLYGFTAPKGYLTAELHNRSTRLEINYTDDKGYLWW